MIPYIENYENPQIGDFFMVRTVEFNRNNKVFHFPVVDKMHRDGKHGLDKPHYHIDWRFMPEFELEAHSNWNNNIYKKAYCNNSEFFTPITKDEVIREYYNCFQYLRDNRKFPEWGFPSLEKAMKNCKMVNMKCPHHGTNLVSCKPVDGVVTCPQHGLKWNVKTGELVV